VPPFVVYAKPASRKFEATLLNCRQPMLILFGLLRSTQMDGSFAASPTLLLPLASTLT
jgi:hypothetical protein